MNEIENAIDRIKLVRQGSANWISEAYDLAIKALEKQLSGMNCIKDGKYTGDSCFGCKVKIEECEIRDRVYRKRWVPVSERLPEGELNCLVTTEKGEALTSKFYGCGEECQGFKEFPEGVWEVDAYDETVIAWQPLPEKYKESDYEHTR